MSLELFFNPSSIVVIGASRTPGKIGHETLRSLVESKKKGLLKAKLYAVNPAATEILGVPTYPSVLKIPDKIDLAVIVTPAKIVPPIVDECGRKGIKNIIVISSNFSEVGGEGVILEEKLVENAKKYGIRVIGPNCIGVFDPYSGVDTLFLPTHKEFPSGPRLSCPRAEKGYVSLITQSGAFGVACIDYMWGNKIGMSKFVSFGNACDVDEVDMIEYLAEDPNTRIILLYIENIKRGREFMEAARKASLKKPIVAFKAGRSSAGARAAASHTGALAGSDNIYEAAFKQCGVIRANNVEEMFDFAKALVYMPPAKNKNVFILTDGGGAGVMCADKAELVGLKVPEPTGKLEEELQNLKDKGVIPQFASIKNPIDLTGSVTDEMYVETLKILLSHEQVGVIVLIALHHVPGLTYKLIDKIASVYKDSKKPLLFVDIGPVSYTHLTLPTTERV